MIKFPYAVEMQTLAESKDNYKAVAEMVQSHIENAANRGCFGTVVVFEYNTVKSIINRIMNQLRVKNFKVEHSGTFEGCIRIDIRWD